MHELTQDEIQDLEWYFGGGAERDCGARSTQTGFEAAMNKMALSGKGRDAREVWVDGEAVWLEADQPARETRSSISASDEAHDRLIDREEALKRMRRIYDRVNRLGQRDHAVLELQFGDASRALGVSLSLLAQTETVKTAAKRVNAKREARARKNGREPPDPIGPREALERMRTSTSSDDKRALEELAKEASGWLSVALAAYSEAR